MSLCLSANDAPISTAATGRWTALGARLRALALSFAEPEDIGDMLPAPPAARVAAVRARRDRTAVPRRATGDEVNTLLL